MARPSDWTPLGCSSDPVPGDPDQVSREAAHLLGVARELAAEVGRLRAVAASADGDAMRGRYAVALHTSAVDIAGQLQLAAVRYEEASVALAAWAPDLAHAQTLSLRTLNEAEAPYLALRNLVPPQVPPSGHVSAAQEQDQQACQRVSQRAQALLDSARALLAKAVSFRDEQAARCAAAIRGASDDKLADYWVFGVSFPGARQAGALLEQAAEENTKALAALLVMQRNQASPELAQAVSAWWRMLPPAQHGAPVCPRREDRLDLLAGL